jgi:hypothetical protein
MEDLSSSLPVAEDVLEEPENETKIHDKTENEEEDDDDELVVSEILRFKKSSLVKR